MTEMTKIIEGKHGNATICAKCKWFKREGDIWYGQFCGNPSRIKEKVNYVTGKFSKELPFARDINTDGMCETFEEINLQNNQKNRK